MVKVLPISFRADSDLKNETKADSKPVVIKKEKYPINYDQYVTNRVLTLTTGSVITGGLTALILRKGFNLSKKTSTTGAVITGACLVLSGLFQGLNGHYKAKYLTDKMKFEKEQR